MKRDHTLKLQEVHRCLHIIILVAHVLIVVVLQIITTIDVLNV